MLTGLFGKLSHSENKLVIKLLFFFFKLFSGSLNLHESKKQDFRSFHDYFIRELKPGLRPIDSDKLAFVSPCDGIVGAFGKIEENVLMQVKQESYKLEDFLCGDSELIQTFRNGTFLTLRIKPNFYHRFHMAYDATIKKVGLIPGELWNINQATLKKVKSLFTKNERAILFAQNEDFNMAIIPVGTVLVGSIKLNMLDYSFNHKYKDPIYLHTDCQAKKGEELGMFHYGSTVVILLDKQVTFAENMQLANFVKVGEKLLTLPASKNTKNLSEKSVSKTMS